MAQESPAALPHKDAALYDEEHAAAHAFWNDFIQRNQRCTISKTSLVQCIVSLSFLFLTVIGTCHLGRAPVCFIEPWLADFLPLAGFQLAVNLIYLLWPDVPEGLVRSRLPIVIQLLAAAGWLLNLAIAGILVFEGFTLGTSYHIIHIPRFVLSVAEVVCTKIILVVTVRQYFLARESEPHLAL